MKVSIEYCNMWNYLPRASSLEADLKKQFPDSDITLISSGGGVFEVTLDGELIFSKKALERFPNPGEVVGLIQDKQ